MSCLSTSLMSPRPSIVLVPTDFSSSAQHALARALRLPLAPAARVVLLHVLPDRMPETLRAEVEAEARTSLAKLVASSAIPDGVVLATEIVTGEAYEQIIARARMLDASLVVIGRHGQRRIRDLLIGSTAERTLRYGDVPVLVVNLEPEGPYRRPLVASDLEDSSLRVVDLARSVLEPEVAIDLVHAFRVPFGGLRYTSGSARLEQGLETEARAALDKLVQSLGDDRARWNPVLRLGDARTVLLTEIVSRDADLAVIGTHGRSGIAHAIVGSVAEWVIAAARCDVLVTRPARFTFAMP